MSDIDKSLADIIRERKLGGQRHKLNNATVKKTVVPRTNTTKSIGAKIKMNRDARNKIVTVNRFQVNDARKRILINRNSKVIDARNKLKRLNLMDARQKLNRLQTLSKKSTFKVGEIKPILKSATSIALTRTVRNDAVRDLNKSRGSRISNTVDRGGGKQVLIDRGGLTIISKPNPPVTVTSPPSLLFSRTVNSLAREASHNAGPVRRSGPATSKVRPSVSKVMKRNLYDDDDLEHATLESFTAAKKHQPTSVGSSSSLSQRLQQRLGSNGIESNRTEMESYKVLVSNLQANVSQEDIVELFGDVGTLCEVKMMKQGTAVAVFFRLSDAQKAVDVYNNRELDGQPMICKILQTQPVKSKAGFVPRLRDAAILGKTATMHSDRISVTQSAKSRITPDVDTIHEALFRRTSSRTNFMSKASITVTV